MMRAEIVAAARGADWRKRDRMLSLGVMLVLDTKGETIVQAVFSKTSLRANVIHCNVWTPNGGGYGNATGWGYHKTSAALEEALHSAGYHLFGNVYDPSVRNKRRAYIGGVGERAMEEAILAVARLDGPRKKYIVKAVW